MKICEKRGLSLSVQIIEQIHTSISKSYCFYGSQIKHSLHQLFLQTAHGASALLGTSFYESFFPQWPVLTFVGSM